METKKRIIIITDGDSIAKQAVETAARNIGARCISRSAGNPTPLSYTELLSSIKRAAGNLVVCMVDDRGNTHEGKGETILEQLVQQKEVDVLGVVAVASNTEGVEGIRPDISITNDSRVIKGSVNKDGDPAKDRIYGDTVDVLKRLNVPLIVGIGDPGKMRGRDESNLGAPITTAAFRAILGFAEKQAGPLSRPPAL